MSRKVKAISRLTIDLRMYRMSGIGRYLRNLIPLVLPRLNADHIRIIGDGDDFIAESWNNDQRVEIYNSKAGIYSLQEQASVIAGAFQSSDLLWVPHYNVPLFYRGRLAVTIHDVCHLALPETLNHPVKRAYARLLLQTATSRSAAIFCVSEFTSKEVQKYLHVPAQKIHITHPGLDRNWDDGVKPHSEPQDVPYFLYVGNVKPNKNLLLLLDAFRNVMHQIPHRLIIVGKIAGMRTVDQDVIHAAQEFGDRIHLAGAVSDDQLMSYYRGAVAFAFPSLYEGFGLPLLEAMKMGCPVLCSNASSLPEVADNAALYFDPGNVKSLETCLLGIVENAELRDKLRLAGLKRVQQFSYMECAEKTSSVLNELLQA